MMNIMCFGDSLTWGAIPNGARHAYEDRWPTVLGNVIGADKVHIVAEGLGGRTTAFDDFTSAANLNGVKILPTILATHQPLDCVIIMLGTNDMKPYLSGNAMAASRGMKRLVQIVQTFPYFDGAEVPKILLVSPPTCVETDNKEMKLVFDGAVSQSQGLAPLYQLIAMEMGTSFFDAASVASASKIDGVHLDAKNTVAIGNALVPIIKNLLKI